MVESRETLPVQMQRIADFAQFADEHPAVAKKIVSAKVLEEVESLARFHGFPEITEQTLREAVVFVRQTDWLAIGFRRDDARVCHSYHLILALVSLLDGRGESGLPSARR